MAGINEFVEKLNRDEDFQNKIEAAADSAEALRIIKEAGFEVTEEELANCFSSDVENAEEGELSDDALDDVNGGIVLIISTGTRAGSKLGGLFGKKKSGATTTQMKGSVGGGVTNALLSGGPTKNSNGPLIC